MLMSTVLGKALAIWLVAGRPLAALFLFGTVEAWYWWRKRKLRTVHTIVHSDVVKPKGEYRLTQ